jgi:steroid 5-alpha reductase family enzyme
MASLPFCIRYIVHAILAFCFPFYSIYQGWLMLISRIHRITYPIYRAVTLLTRLFTFFITLPVRIITFAITKTQTLLKSLLILAIIAGIIVGIITLFLDEHQLDYFKSYVRNTTDVILKHSSII